mgnify:CR=1 FL=1
MIVCIIHLYVYAFTDLSQGKALLNPFIMELETVKQIST